MRRPGRPGTHTFPSEQNLRGVVLVEGPSDQAAVVTLARRSGRDLAGEGISVVAMGGAQAIGRFWDAFGPQGRDIVRGGLCDVAEESHFRRGLEGDGHGLPLTRESMEALGFFVCTVDLEDEMIRALGTAIVERIVADQAELDAFRTFQRQPAWRGKPIQAQLGRFIGTRSGRKIRYGRLLAEALDPTQVPRPLHRLLMRM
ncbi:hypothetical protein BH24ACT15_BH24ACT15_06740 [soil metagenome]